MPKKLDKILVVDVESTCWPGKAPEGESSEIIEVGVCMLDVASKERVAKESILVRPERSRVSEFCTRLTTLTQAQVDQGVSFEGACNILREKYKAKQRTWASWGAYDQLMFSGQCMMRRVEYPFGSRHINVKNLFALMHKLPHEVGMVKAMALLDLPIEGTHHRGGDDAWNIAAILAILLNK